LEGGFRKGHGGANGRIMGKLNIDDLKEGMVLEKDLFNSKGRFLLPRGTVIGGRHIRIMKTWGVMEAAIEGISNEAMEHEQIAAIHPEILGRSEVVSQKLFRLNDLEHPAVKELYRLSVLRIAGKLSANRRAEVWVELPENGGKASRGSRGQRLSAEEVVERNMRLVSLPDIYFRILEVLDNPRSSATHIGDIVSKDTSISAKLLKVVNSPFYGFPYQIDTISRAVALIGTNELSTLALGITAVDHFKSIPPRLITVKDFWRHSIACGVLAKILAHYKFGLSEERFFTAGLLHDIGRIIMFSALPETMAEVLWTSGEHPSPIYSMEREAVGFDHATLGGLLARKWRFPTSLEMIEYHHRPHHAVNVLDPSIIHVADVMANALAAGTSGAYFVPPLQSRAWDALELSVNVLNAAAKQADRQVVEITKAFIGEDI